MKFGVVVLVLSLLGCGGPVKTPSHVDTVKMEEAETVELVTLRDSGWHVYCAGVWVSPSKILTAAHCALAMAPEGEDREEWNPIGQPISYRVQDDEHVHDALILSYSLTADLAIIDARPPVTPVVASLSQDPIEVGTWVDIIGHPIGYEWSYARGWVSAYRPFERNTHRLPMLTLQVAGPISPGNSGGGAFDASGRLVGIASYMDVRLNGMAFFVHRDAIRQFLKENGIS